MKYGIITGSAFDDLFIQFERNDIRVDTDYGEIKGYEVAIGDHEIYILPRHGVEERIFPSDVNYHGIIQAMEILKVRKIIALNSVGIVNPYPINYTEEGYPPLTVGCLTFISDFIDMTKHRISCFDDSDVHLDMSNPFDVNLQNRIKKMCSKDIGGKYIKLSGDSIYVCTEGPRFETKAEIAIFREWGAHVVGMTLVPEVVLANELEIPYASLAICTNYAAGTQDRITFDEVRAEISKVKYQIDVLLQRTILNDKSIGSED